MEWSKITDVILGSSIAVLAVFAILGLYQWITRRSFRKVDIYLKAFIPPFALLVVTYVVFDKILILNTRPDGSGEPSFPSTHAMIVTTVFLCSMLALRRYVAKLPLRIALDLIMVILISLVSVGRVLADKHWPSDVVAGLIFAVIFAALYYFLIRKYSPGDIISPSSPPDSPH